MAAQIRFSGDSLDTSWARTSVAQGKRVWAREAGPIATRRAPAGGQR